MMNILHRLPFGPRRGICDDRTYVKTGNGKFLANLHMHFLQDLRIFIRKNQMQVFYTGFFYCG